MIGNSSLMNYTSPSIDYDSVFNPPADINHVPWVICILIVICVGLIGNLMSMALLLILKEVRKTTMHLFIFNLAVSDFVFLTVFIFQQSESLNGVWIYSDFLCKLNNSLQQLCHVSSALFLSAISIDRFVDTFGGSSTGKVESVRRFFRSYTYQRIMVIIYWILGAVYATYIGVHTHKMGFEPNCRCGIYFPDDCSALDEDEKKGCEDLQLDIQSCLTDIEFAGNLSDYYVDHDSDYEDYGNETYNYEDVSEEERVNSFCRYIDMTSGWYTSIYVRFIFTFLVPGLIMIFSNYWIARNVMKTSVMRLGEENEGKQQRRLQAIKCLALVAWFIVGGLPTNTFHMLKIKGIAGVSNNFCKHFDKFATLFGTLHSALNPIIYMMIGNDFGPRIRNAKKTLLELCGIKHTHSTSDRRGDVVKFNLDSTADGGYSVGFPKLEPDIVKNTEEIN